MTGFLERSLYMAALLGEYATFVGLWLGLKVAGWWNGTTEALITKPARASVFTSFLIGNGLSVAYAGVGFVSIGLLRGEQWQKALVLMASLVLLTLALWLRY